MANINLATQEAASQSGDGFSFSGGGLLGSLTVFVLVLLLWGGLIFWGNSIQKETESVQNEYSLKYGNFTNSNAKEIVDFKNRLNFARESSAKSVNIRGTLEEIERLLIPSEVWLGSYKFDEKNKGLVLSCRAKNYNLVARQILSFKKSDYFVSVSGGKTQLDRTNGIISFEVNLTLK